MDSEIFLTQLTNSELDRLQQACERILSRPEMEANLQSELVDIIHLIRFERGIRNELDRRQ